MMRNRNTHGGFSLIETAIATAIIATTGLVLIALLGRISLQTSDLRQGAALRRSVATTRHFMHSADFEDVYQKVRNSPPALAIYDYYGDESDVRNDGSLKPSDEISGSTLTSAARWTDDTDLPDDLTSVPDFVFRAQIEPIDEELPSDSIEFEKPSLSLKVTMWEATVDSVQIARETKPDHIFYVHVRR